MALGRQVTELTDVTANQFLTIQEKGVGLQPRTVVTAPGSNITLRATVVGSSLPAVSMEAQRDQPARGHRRHPAAQQHPGGRRRHLHRRSLRRDANLPQQPLHGDGL